MRKLVIAAIFAAAAAFPNFAESPFVFFSDQVPRHEGLGFGAFFNNSYAIGGWRDYAAASVNFGVHGEYTLPRFLPLNMDLGASGIFEVGSTVPKKNSTLDSRGNIRLAFGAFLRIPFTAWNQRFSFQPEICWGIDASRVKGKNGSSADGWYTDQIFMISPALRWTPPGEKFEKLEFEFSPIWTFSPERHGNVVNELGFSLGAVWHLDLFSMGKGIRTKSERKAKEEENRRKAEEAAALAAQKAAEDEARLKAEEEARKKAALAGDENLTPEQEAALSKELKKELSEVLAKPELLLGVDPKELKDFTPDGDGEGDTITFRPSTKYLARAAESWSLKILEPNGNTFRTWTGGGNPPEEIVWDGKGDQGEGVFSYNIYKAQLQVVPSAKDKERLGMESLEASVQGSVEIKTGIVLERSGPDEWKIEMTSLPFDPNGATFNNLNASQRAELNKTVDDIYKKVLSIGSAAKVRVNGYGNNLSGTDKEEKEDVLPLSQARAQMMADLLVQRGIEAQSVSAVGRGSADPIAARDDRSNWWKNRRVEFIISR